MEFARRGEGGGGGGQKSRKEKLPGQDPVNIMVAF